MIDEVFKMYVMQKLTDTILKTFYFNRCLAFFGKRSIYLTKL